MFTMYPYTRDWFPNFRTDAIKIYSDENMKAHVITVIQAIQMLVDHSFDSDTLIALVEKMARMHLHKSVTTIEVEVGSISTTVHLTGEITTVDI